MATDDADFRRAIAARRRNRFLWLVFLLFPPAAILFTFVFLPMASALWYSVYDWNGLVRGEFVGLGNFRDVLFDPNRNWFLFNAFRNNVIVFVSLMITSRTASPWPSRWSLPASLGHRVSIKSFSFCP